VVRPSRGLVSCHWHVGPLSGAAECRTRRFSFRLKFEMDLDLRIAGPRPILTVQKCLKSCKCLRFTLIQVLRGNILQ